MSQVLSSHSSTDRAPGLPMTPIACLGVALWVVGVATVHVAAPFGAFDPPWALPLLLATPPLAWLSNRLVRRLAPPSASVVEVVALACAPALLLDGLAFTWAPTVYSVVPAEQRAASAWLLWFVGVALALAFWQAARQRRGTSP